MTVSLPLGVVLVALPNTIGVLARALLARRPILFGGVIDWEVDEVRVFVRVLLSQVYVLPVVVVVTCGIARMLDTSICLGAIRRCCI
jgi:hypothetical protein